MSRLLATLLIVAGLAALVAKAELVRPGRSSVPTVQWVRTADGWEPRDAVTIAVPAAPPTLHPAVVAGFLAAASSLALVAFPRSKGD